MTGAPNFRAVAPGLTGLRPHRLYRSSDLAELTPEDLACMDTLGIRLLLDLRSDLERGARPNRWPAAGSPVPVTTLLGRVDTDVRARHAALRDILVSDPGQTGARRMMFATYAGLPQAVSGSLTILLNRLAQEPGPALIQCTAGKDRTGFTVACVLRALDFSLDAIIEDYLGTPERNCVSDTAAVAGAAIEQMLGVALSPESIAIIGGVDAEYLMAGFGAVDKEYGSFDAYLRTLDVSTRTLDRLRQILTDDSKN